MTTIPSIDFFAPIGRNSRCGELLALQATTTIVPFSPQILPNLRADAADHVTYIILGLALLIAIVVPILNLN